MTEHIGTNVQNGGDEIRSFALLSLWSDVVSAVEHEPRSAQKRLVVDLANWRARDAVRSRVPAPLYRMAVEGSRSSANVSLLVDVNALLASAVDELPPQERTVIALYYFERLPLKEIKNALKISESRISHVHARAVKHLRARFSTVQRGAHGAREPIDDVLERFRSISPASESIAIRNGLPANTWSSLQLLGFNRDDIASVVGTSEKTIQRKVAASEALAVSEGDRTMRLTRVMLQAFEAFGNPDKAFTWLRRPNRALHGQTPLETMVTEAGTALVRRALGVIAYGGVA